MILLRQRLAFGLLIPKERIMYTLQFSLKDPWLIPKLETYLKDGMCNFLCGWLFVYFGITYYLR